MAPKKPTYQDHLTGPIYRFDDRNSGFSRYHRQYLKQKSKEGNGEGSSTDQFVKGKPASEKAKKGYERKDYALAWAGRTIDYLVRENLYSRDGDIAGARVDISDKRKMTEQVRAAARWFGADLVGICKVNPMWVYSHWGDYNAFYSGGRAKAGDPIEIPSWFEYAVVMAIEMDYEDLKRSPAVDAATILGYAKMAFIAPSVATFIRQLGYHALPSGNDYGLNIPLAIDAGLGELGRNGQLITKKFGPRVRICKVFTDLPLEVDTPIDMGVQAFCERCEICAEKCPSHALMGGERTDKAWDESNSIHVLKWPVKAMNCLSWWEKNKSHCSNCIRVCPFNKPAGWLHEATKEVIRVTSVFNRFLVRIDGILGYGQQVIK
jgi:reductive dehalogenase